MSTVGQPHLEPSWKQEVNQRLAAHKSRKGGNNQQARPEPAAAMNSRAAEAAARVAARYAAAPSYSQMQAEEARVAVRAAQIATKVAMEAQAVAESALAELHAAAEAPARRPAVVESIARTLVVECATLPCFDESQLAPVHDPGPEREAPIAVAVEPRHAHLPETIASAAIEAPVVVAEPEPALPDRDSLSVRWETDMPSRAIEMPTAPSKTREQFELAAEDWWTPAQMQEALRNEPLVVNAQQGHANLIEFPRELIATRKMRPRIHEAQAQHGVEGQLSIFEVDPGAVSIEPELEPMPAQEHSLYSGPEWSGIQLDEHPIGNTVPQSAAQDAQKPDLAPAARRLMTYVVDGAMILASFFVVAMLALAQMSHVPAPRSTEVLSALGLVLVAAAYHALFFGLGLSTPGMRYAGIALSTFDDDLATPAQMRRRLGAMLVSLAPFGLGMVWAIFDDDHLSWHDRISGTYLRKKI